jgi:membrane associated rhomboid family serine protease
MIFPLGMVDKAQRRPVALLVIIGGCTLLWWLQTAVDSELSDFFLHKGEDFHFYQFLTHQFLHDPEGVSHLLFNMFFLWIFGALVNERLGHGKFLILFVLSGLGASILYWWNLEPIRFNFFDQALFEMLNDTGEMPVIFPSLVGASGAIMGIVASTVVLFPKTKMSVLYFFFFGRIAVGKKAVAVYWVALFYFACDLFYMLMLVSDGVAYGAHVGGFLTGFTLTLVARKLSWVQGDHWDLVALVSGQKELKKEQKIISDERGQLKRDLANLPEILEQEGLDIASELIFEGIEEIGIFRVDAEVTLTIMRELHANGRFAELLELGELFTSIHPTHEKVGTTSLILGEIAFNNIMDLNRSHYFLSLAKEHLEGGPHENKTLSLYKQCQNLRRASMGLDPSASPPPNADGRDDDAPDLEI